MEIDYKGIAKRLMRGDTPSQVAFDMHVDIRTVEATRDRVVDTGSVFPSKPGTKPGSVLQHKRKTTVGQDNRVKPTIMKERGGRFEFTARMLTTKLGMKVSRVVGGRRIREKGFRAFRPARKEQYDKDERRQRKRYAQRYRIRAKAQWRRTVFLDEHYFTFSTGKTRSRQVHSRKRFVYRLKGGGKKERYHPDCVAPSRGKYVRGGTQVGMSCAIYRGKPLVCKPCSAYVAATKVPTKTIRRTAKGKRVGRPPKKHKGGPKKRGYDRFAHAAFLKEVAEKAHKIDPGALLCLQDGVPLHWAPACMEVIEAESMHFTDDHPTYSPDLNCIENSFAEADADMAKIPESEFPTTVSEAVAKFQSVYRRLCPEGYATSEQYFLGLANSMPERMEDTVKAKGGATRW
jgi:hypothetical protein